VTIRILLVDDHKMMRDGLRSVLASDPEIEVIGEAADGRAAIELAKTLRPELVGWTSGAPR
jgi:DNA-binding NarL/FixJ family response regulator